MELGQVLGRNGVHCWRGVRWIMTALPTSLPQLLCKRTQALADRLSDPARPADHKRCFYQIPSEEKLQAELDLSLGKHGSAGNPEAGHAQRRSGLPESMLVKEIEELAPELQ
jgi:hypothetical protein